jgi:hypothetical protein
VVRALVGILLIGGVALGGCGAQSIGGRAMQASPTVAPTPTVTPTALPARPLSWKPGTAPIRLVREIDPPVQALVTSPADGRAAYLCGANWTNTNTDVQPDVWVTTDRAAHWTLITPLPLPRHFNSCHMVVNDTNVASAVVEMIYDSATPDTDVTDDFATFDGGKSWSQIGASNSERVAQLASLGDTIYALTSSPTDDGGQPHLFVASSATFADPRAWQRADTGLPAPIQRLWLNPRTGALLATISLIGNQPQLWQSTDGGKS